MRSHAASSARFTRCRCISSGRAAVRRVASGQREPREFDFGFGALQPVEQVRDVSCPPLCQHLAVHGGESSISRSSRFRSRSPETYYLNRRCRGRKSMGRVSPLSPRVAVGHVLTSRGVFIGGAAQCAVALR